MKKVTDSIYRGVRPESEEERQALLDAGIRSILSLESDAFEILTGRLNEEIEWATSKGIFLEHLELSAVLRPKVDFLKTAVAIMHIAEAPLYVHCKQGVDRTGLVCASYRILIQGWSIEQAKQEMLDEGFHLWRYWWWIPVLDKLKGVS